MPTAIGFFQLGPIYSEQMNYNAFIIQITFQIFILQSYLSNQYNVRSWANYVTLWAVFPHPLLFLSPTPAHSFSASTYHSQDHIYPVLYLAWTILLKGLTVLKCYNCHARNNGQDIYIVVVTNATQIHTSTFFRLTLIAYQLLYKSKFPSICNSFSPNINLFNYSINLAFLLRCHQKVY